VNFASNASAGNYSFSLTAGTGNNGQPVGFSPLPMTGATITIGVATATPTYTFTPTVTLTPTPFTNQKPVVYPNPSDGGPVQVLPPPYAGTSNVTIEIFTTAFRRVSHQTLLSQPYGPLTIQMVDDWNNPLASGLYYIVIQTNSGKSVGKILILR
jgi:hypothetical protein